MDLNYQTSSAVKAAKYDEAERRWQVRVEVGGGAAAQAQVQTLSPSHLVFATGMSGYARRPEFDDASLQ